MIRSAIIQGLEPRFVEVEVGIGSGKYLFKIVGLGRTEVKESEHRLINAIEASGYYWPDDPITVNLAPADVPKGGTALDLPIALAILIKSGQIKSVFQDDVYAIGELSLEGKLRAARGALAIARAMPDQTILLAPKENECELALLRKIKEAAKAYYPYAARTLKEVIQVLQHGEGHLASVKNDELKPAFEKGTDFSEVKGQAKAKRALEVAAAGGHNVLLIGPPGEGKSLLAKAMPTILPLLKPQEIIDLTSIYSSAGKLPSNNSIIRWRPFRKVHHTASRQALVGGGSGFPQPGEITLAHRGVLFLDEILEFGRGLLETMRQPLEDGEISISRASGNASYPCEMILVAAMNPCPCGLEGEYLCRGCSRRLSDHQSKCPDCGSNERNSRCSCTESEKRTYKAKLSGPIMDRIDLKIRVSALSAEDRFGTSDNVETSLSIRKRVEAARDLQEKRFEGQKFMINARIAGGVVDKYCELHPSARAAMHEVAKRVPELTTRGHDKLLKIARTVADLNRSGLIYKKHIAEAAELCGYDDVRVFLMSQTEVEACPVCGEVIDMKHRFCPSCGANIGELVAR